LLYYFGSGPLKKWAVSLFSGELRLGTLTWPELNPQSLRGAEALSEAKNTFNLYPLLFRTKGEETLERGRSPLSYSFPLPFMK